MENKLSNCPKCGFKMTDNYCVKCGYVSKVFIYDLDKYDLVNDVYRYMKDSYQKVIYNKNLLLIFILGPMYFSYFKFYIMGFMLFVLELIVAYFINNLFMYSRYELYYLLFYYFCVRLLYIIFSNFVLLKLIRRRLNRWKQRDDYKIKISNSTACSIFSLLGSVLLIILILVVFVIWYRLKNGTI